MKRLLVELETLPEAGKAYLGELDTEIFGIDDDEVTATGPLHYDLFIQRFGDELFVKGSVSAPFQFRCVRCLNRFDYVVEVTDFATSIAIENRAVVDVSDAMREEVVIEFPAYPKCADGGLQNDCVAGNSHFRVDKQGEPGVNCPAPSKNNGVWDALDRLGDQAGSSGHL